MARQAAAYRDKRVLLAGDAAHVHHPVGGQGLNTGVQDAVNLGWKLAQVVKQTSPDSLLDTYHAERHPVAARVLRNTMAQMALLHRPDDRTKALRDTISEFLSMDEPRKRFAAMMSGLDIHYHLGEGHGAWNALWVTFRTLIGLLVSVGAYEDAAVLSGAAESARAGFPPFGSDAVTLRDAKERMRSELGDAVFRQCADKGSVLREDEVVRFALDALNRAAQGNR